MKKFFKKVLFVVLVMGIMVSCNNNDDDIPAGEGVVSVKLTDAPFPFNFVKKANVGIAKVELKNTAGEYVVVFEGSSDFNMVGLTNGKVKTVGKANIKKGTYKEARITLKSASVELSNGKSFMMNDEAQGSYTVAIDPVLEVESGENSNVLFDLDINNSYKFNSTGTGLDWISNILSIVGCSFDADFRVCDLDKTGEIKGKVTVSGSSEANAYVFVKVNGKQIGTQTKSDGTYRFIGIKEGNYTVSVKTEANGSKSEGNIQVKGTGTAVCNLNL